MFIGEWNKSVILTYIGMAVALLGIHFSFRGEVIYAITCLMIAGVCDLIDGMVARRSKRNEMQKEFGIQLDSLVDVISFVALPVTIALTVGMNRWYMMLFLVIFGIGGVARLAFFNACCADGDGPVPHYRGLPVTATAIILPFAYLLHLVLTPEVFVPVYGGIMLVIGILNILDIKVPKPKGKAYVFFSLLAIVMLTVYLVVL